MQYMGEIYSVDSDYGHKKLNEYKNKSCTYLMSISKNEVIDPTLKGNLARFINHSCEPNCETQKWHVLGEICVGIFTLRDIQDGEELTFNYKFDIMKTTYQKCLCGTASCKGYLGIVKNDVSRGQLPIVCESCKNSCKGNEGVVMCDICKKVFHKMCIRKYKNQSIVEKDFNCSSCLKKEKNQDKKSSQQLIKEFKRKKELISTTIKHVEEGVSIIVDDTFNNITMNLDDIVDSNTSKFQIEEKDKESENSNSVKISRFMEEEPQDETIEVEERQLRKIITNLKILTVIGARLFWDYRQVNNQNSLTEIKITGTAMQIEKVKDLINKILEDKESV